MGKIPTREEVIQAVKEIQAEGKLPSKKTLQQRNINQYWLDKLIPEGLTKLKETLGIKPSPQEKPHSDEELLNIIDKVVSKLNKIPTWKEIRRETEITDKVFRGHFGKKGIREVFDHYREWLEKDHPESANIELADAYLEGESNNIIPQAGSATSGGIAKGRQWQKGPGREYGASLSFGNLVYEPVNEWGVVFLFGMVSRFLGFQVESIGPDFPDCIAKRTIKGRGNRQQSVKIEFEYRSRDFNHDVEGCDIIVCWHDNWGSDCPVEVVELRSEIKKLRELKEFKLHI